MPVQKTWTLIKSFIKVAYGVRQSDMTVPGTVGYKLEHLPNGELEASAKAAFEARTHKSGAHPNSLFKVSCSENKKEEVTTKYSFDNIPSTIPKVFCDSIRSVSDNYDNYSIFAIKRQEFRDTLKLDISFFESVEEWLEKKNINHVDFYNYSNISRQTYYRMKTQLGKPPTKAIALACAVGLELTVDQANELLKKAGFSLSDSNITDVIVQAFLYAEVYDIDLINETILYFDGTPIGSSERT